MAKSKKNFHYPLIVLGLIVVVTAALLLAEREPEQSSDEISTTVYSINGIVSSVSDESFILQAGRVENTEGGNKYVMRERKVVLEDPFSILIKGQEEKTVPAESIPSYIHPGSNVTAYGEKDPFEGDSFKVFRLDVTR